MRLVVDLQGAQGDNRGRGIGRYARELARAMAADPRGHDLHILLNAALPTEEVRRTLSGVLPPEALHLWHSPGGTAWNAAPPPARRHAAEILRAEAIAALRPDILHVSSVFEGWVDSAVTSWPTARARPPTVATGYDLIPLIRRADYLDGAWKRDGIAPWYRHCLHELRQADAALAISQSSRAELIGHLAFPEDRVAAIMAGIGAEFRPPRTPPGPAFRARLGLRESFVLFLGGGDLRKNETGLIRAWGLLPPALRARHQLVIVRRGDPAPLRAEARAAGLDPEALHLIDHVDEADLPALYAACTLFVFPSVHEGFGLPAAEAMACGAATIASDSTSLPEVIGRADALFDPTDPAAIAARLRAVLDDPALLADLRAHAPVQAARFNWPDVAARAWDALEETHAAVAATAWVSAARPRLACVTPVPPQASGIADYAAELLPELARHYDITLVAEVPTTAESLAPFPLIAPSTFLDNAARFDRVLHQIGNSSFHATSLHELLPRAGGVATLHDTFLSNAESWIAHNRGGGAPAFTEALFRAHGWPAVLHEHRDGHESALRTYPCSLPVLQHALATIQHSRHARDLLETHFGPAVASTVHLIPHLRHPLPPHDRAAARRALGIAPDGLLICTFGHVALTKLPVLLAEAFRLAALPAARLAYVGPAEPPVRALLPADAIATGHVDQPTYRLWLAAADIAMQLRTTSRGETSGAMLDAMAAGTALVANAHGAAAELPPDAVHLLPDPPTAADLAEALRILADPAMRATQAAHARVHLAQHHAPRAVARAYRDVIEAAYETAPRHRATLALAAALGPTPDPALLSDCARALATTWPAPRPPTYLIDAARLPAEAARIANLLATHAPGIRIELAEQTGPTWRLARTRAASLLGLPAPPAPDEPADPADKLFDDAQREAAE